MTKHDDRETLLRELCPEIEHSERQAEQLAQLRADLWRMREAPERNAKVIARHERLYRSIAKAGRFPPEGHRD